MVRNIINNLSKSDQHAFTFIDLFAGIGGFHTSASNLGGKCVFASEIDKEAQKAYAHNYKLIPHGDIFKIHEKDIPEHYMLCAGFPCQPFSIIEKRKGFDDIRGTLFFEILRILTYKKPPCFVLENVKQLASHNQGETLNVIISKLKETGYTVYHRVLNALNFGLPQKKRKTGYSGFFTEYCYF